jgi:hypothetical protein
MLVVLYVCGVRSLKLREGHNLKVYQNKELRRIFQSSWLLIQRSGFDFLRQQIFWEVVCPEQGPLSLVSTIKELLLRKISGSGLVIYVEGQF